MQLAFEPGFAARRRPFRNRIRWHRLHCLGPTIPLHFLYTHAHSPTLSPLSLQIYMVQYINNIQQKYFLTVQGDIYRGIVYVLGTKTHSSMRLCARERREGWMVWSRGGLVVLERERENRREREGGFPPFLHTHLFIYFTLNVCVYDFCALFVRFFSSFYFFNLPFWWALLFYGRFFIFHFVFCFNFFLKKQIKKKIVSSFLTLYYALGSPNSNPMPDAAGNFNPC